MMEIIAGVPVGNRSLGRYCLNGRMCIYYPHRGINDRIMTADKIDGISLLSFILKGVNGYSNKIGQFLSF